MVFLYNKTSNWASCEISLIQRGWSTNTHPTKPNLQLFGLRREFSWSRRTCLSCSFRKTQVCRRKKATLSGPEWCLGTWFVYRGPCGTQPRRSLQKELTVQQTSQTEELRLGLHGEEEKVVTCECSSDLEFMQKTTAGGCSVKLCLNPYTSVHLAQCVVVLSKL